MCYDTRYVGSLRRVSGAIVDVEAPTHAFLGIDPQKTHKRRSKLWKDVVRKVVCSIDKDTKYDEGPFCTIDIPFYLIFVQ